MLADQRDELLRRNKECDCVNETEQPQNNKARQPVGISGRQKLLKKIIAIIHRRTARLTNKLQRLDGFGVRSVTSFSKRGAPAQRIPARIEAKIAVGWASGDFRDNFELLDRSVVLARPR